MAKMAVGERFKTVKLYVLLTGSLCRKPVVEVARDILTAGVDCIQLREKDLADKELLSLARQVCQCCHQQGALFLMNDRPDLALLAGADGVHLGQDDLAVCEARQILHPGKIVGKSTHSQTELVEAMAASPDYMAVGAIFSSATKPAVPAIGLERLRQIAANAACPIVAIGGITPDNAAEVFSAGASAIAVCRAVIASDHPGRAVEQFLSTITHKPNSPSNH
jgi:thiamine-phosphate pyrophosphorylase